MFEHSVVELPESKTKATGDFGQLDGELANSSPAKYEVNNKVMFSFHNLFHNNKTLSFVSRLPLAEAETWTSPHQGSILWENAMYWITDDSF